MGARTNYTIITTDNPAQNINVYAHWDGEVGEDILFSAVKSARPRIDMGDTAYAARIIIDQLTKEGRDSETGYGIYIGEEIYYEEEYTYKEVDLIQHTITIGDTTYALDKWLNAVV
jgi:hypothetical protein